MKSRFLFAPLLFLVPCIVAAQTPNSFVPTGSLSTARAEHTATLLPNGKVLIAGGANSTNVFPGTELYDPSTGMFVSAGNLVTSRHRHTATLLTSGNVLIAGGDSTILGLTAAELYDPSSGTFSATGSMATGRSYHTATLLQTGKVLLVGGYGPSGINTSAELYDPVSGTFTTTGSMQRFRYAHTATLLPNGLVLITGGVGIGTEATAEIYDPSTEIFTLLANSMTSSRAYHTATLLPNGKVLLTGGDQNVSFTGNALSTAELCDPAADTFTSTGSMTTPRFLHTATLLSNGQVLVAGGDGNTILVNDSAELYDGASSFASTGSMSVARDRPTATLLPNGNVLVAGGSDGVVFLASAEIYQLSGGIAGPPTITSISPTSGMQGQTISNFTVNGNNFQPGATLSFSGDAGIAVASATVTATQIVCNLSITIIAGVGPRDLVITNPDGQKATLSGAFTVDLTSSPLQPAVSVSPSVLTFGSVTPQGSQTQTVTITNSGTAPLLLYGVGSLGNVAAAFSFNVSNPSSTTINPNSSATVTVTFSPFPNTLGTISAILGITSNIPTRNTYVTMTGTVATPNKPLSLLPVDSPLPNPPLDIQTITNHQVGNTIVTNFIIRNLTDTWYEVTLDPNDPNGPPHPKAPNWLNSASTTIPNSFMIAPRQALTFPQSGTPLVFSSGQYLQFFATNKSLNASIVFSLDMAIRGLFGTPVIPNPSTPILSELLAYVKDVKVQALACEVSAQQTLSDALVNKGQNTAGWDAMASDAAGFIGCLAANQVIVSDVQRLLQVTLGSSVANQWTALAKTLSAATVAYYFVNNFWTYMVPLGWAQLTSNSPGYLLLEVPLPGP